MQRLVERIMPDGAHHVTFDGSTLPSGLYIYRLESDGDVSTGKMTLVR